MSEDAFDEARLQFAALPYRLVEGRVQVLMITSRETRRWVIPKGWPMKGKTPPQAAAQEAHEEAGITGVAEEESIGAYDYLKRLKKGGLAPCRVIVYALPVAVETETWPEQAQRERRWLPWREAAEQVQEPDLADLIRRFGKGRSKRAWWEKLADR